jgi:UDP:flavonoid glycosyltransferase YjiC (YdhE family)
MVCIPLSVDQPLVAHRVAIELGLGIMLDADRMKSKDIRSAVHEVLHDPSYNERCVRYSQLSRQYSGQQNSASLCIDYIKACEYRKMRTSVID